MSQLRYVTLNGVDEHTFIGALIQTSRTFPEAEWGVLYDPRKAGGDNSRYPSLDWIEQFAEAADTEDLPIALHLCGPAVTCLVEAAKFILDTRDWRKELGEKHPEAKRLFALAEKFGRVQLNVVAKRSEDYAYREIVNQLTRSEKRTRVILQWTSGNKPVCQTLAFEHGFEVLIDSSGGRGIERDSWPNLTAEFGLGGPRRAGFAGGLGPDNLADQLPLILEAAEDKSFWIGMETKLRNEHDHFDVPTCEKVLEIVRETMRQAAYKAGELYGDGFHEVSELEGLWLDYWVGAARGRNVVVPPMDASKAVSLDRHRGDFDFVNPTEDLAYALQILAEERIRLDPVSDDLWEAQAKEEGSEAMQGEELHIAGLRAVVAKVFGTRVSQNPYRQSDDAGYLF